VDVTNGNDQTLWRRIGDAQGAALYTYDADRDTGKATCVAECAEEFPPYIAPRDALVFGEWSLVTRDGGVKQWAYRGQPLYYYSGPDPAAQKPTGRRGRDGDAQAALNPASRLYAPKDGWTRAAYMPGKEMPVPSGIELQSLAVANGYGLVSASTGMPMYVLRTPPKNPLAWTPVYVPALASPMGDFTISRREDGTNQWAYNGQALYTYNADYSTSDLNGLLAEPGAQAALAYRHFIPQEVSIKILPHRGPLLTTAKGMSVYTQSRYKLQYGGRHTRDGYRYSYATAKAVGVRGCVGECLKLWRPVVAPGNARSSGFWEVVTRADGVRQWAYKGSPLYTFAGDRKPGDIGGNNRHEIFFGDPDGKIDLAVTGGDDFDDTPAGAGLYWHLAGLFN
jgi:predicted lipoprotein with Yx(FWY)xxD motif